MFRGRAGIFDDVVEAVAARDVRVIARAMDVVGRRARYGVPDPSHMVVLQHLLERIDECATSVGGYALVIADEVDGQARHRADASSRRGPVPARSRRGTRSIRYVTEQVGEGDFVVVTEARRVSGITDVADLTMVNLLLLLSCRNNDLFTRVIDNTDRYIGARSSRAGIR